MSSPANVNNASKSRVLTRKTSIENSPKGGGNAVEVKSEERRGKPVDLVVASDKVAAPCSASKPTQAAMTVPGQHQPQERDTEGEEKRKASSSADTKGSSSSGEGATQTGTAMAAPALVKKEPPQPTSGVAPPKPAKPAAPFSNSKNAKFKAAKFKGTSQYRGVAQHRVTQRWESHVWENKKQIYLGSFATEKLAAVAYDKAAIFLNKDRQTLNFPYSDYAAEAPKLHKMTKEKLLAHLRRGSQGFSRGKTRFRGVSFRAHTGRWEARISGVEDNKYSYLGTYDKPEQAAVAYDKAAIALKGKFAVTNYDISSYETELGHLTRQTPETLGKNSQTTMNAVLASKEQYYKDLHKNKGKKGPGRQPVASTVLDKAVRAAHAQHQQQAKTRLEDRDKESCAGIQGKTLTRQTNFCLPNQVRLQAGGSRKKKPSKRDRSFNSDFKVQEAYAPITKVIHPGPHHMVHGPAGLYKASPGLYPPTGRTGGMCFAPGTLGDDPFGLLSFGSDSVGGHSIASDQSNTMTQMDDLTQAKFLSRHPQGLSEYCPEAGTILPGMVRPPANMDIPITAFRAAQAAGNPEVDQSQAQDDFQAMQLEQLLQQMSNPGSGGSGRDPYFIFPPSDNNADAIGMGPIDGKRGPHRSEEDSLFSAMTTQSLTSQVNSAAEVAGLDLHHQSAACDPSGAPLGIPASDLMAQAGVKSEFDIYFEKLLDYHQGETEVDDHREGEGFGMVASEGAALRGKVVAVGSHGHSASLGHSGQGAQNQGSKHEIEENLSAFLNNISLTDIPEIAEGEGPLKNAEIAGLCDMVPTDKAFKTSGSDMSLLNNFEL